MKIDIIEQPQDRKIEFPCIMKHVQNEFFVLFFKDREGIFLSGEWKGRRQENFITVYDENLWERLPVGTKILLTNDDSVWDNEE